MLNGYVTHVNVSGIFRLGKERTIQCRTCSVIKNFPHTLLHSLKLLNGRAKVRWWKIELCLTEPVRSIDAPGCKICWIFDYFSPKFPNFWLFFAKILKFSDPTKKSRTWTPQMEKQLVYTWPLPLEKSDFYPWKNRKIEKFSTSIFECAQHTYARP